MQTGSDTWKWGVVFILLAIFMVTANQAYQHVTSQEHYEPPDDYMKGDSWDIEHQSGPGAGQAVQLPADDPAATDPILTASEAVIPDGDADAPLQAEDIDWNNLKDPAETGKESETQP
ncbi:MAG TPA: hypothetical protein PLM07_07640 [Candidatus Rifleibacterium sp.]|nr:hypothetical protein [Candidatus Rifleibacterium sp.]HPT45757.1 hypothetical protein [Candidatus Rifleibacterium sp.]